MNEIDQINEVLAALVNPEIRKIASLDSIIESDEFVLVVNTMTGSFELYDLTAGEIEGLEPVATARIAIPEQMGGCKNAERFPTLPLPEYFTAAEITDLSAAIDRSISHTEIAHMTGDAEKILKLLKDTEAVTSLDSADEGERGMDVWGAINGEDFRILIRSFGGEGPFDTAAEAWAVEWAKNEIKNDPDGSQESDMGELEEAYASIFGQRFPDDCDRDEHADPRGYAMWSEIRDRLGI